MTNKRTTLYYIGRYDEVYLPSQDLEVPRFGSISVEPSAGEALLEQPDNWTTRDPKGGA